MKRIDRILAVLDPTADAQPALRKAADLARSCSATLDLLVCDYDPALSGQPFAESETLARLREAFLADRRAALDPYAAELRAGGLEVETHVRWGHPLHRSIVEYAVATSPDLVVKDTHYHGLLRRTLFTNTDWNLIRACPLPLLLAKERAWPASPRIVAALDPGHLGDKPAVLDHDILDWAGLLAERTGGELHAVHAFFPAALLAATAFTGDLPLAGAAVAAEVVAAERERLGRAFEAVLAAHPVAPARVHLEEGAAAEVLPRFVETLDAALVVMGAVSRSRVQEVFLGSTAERVLDRIGCDVLVVKPPDFTERLPF